MVVEPGLNVIVGWARALLAAVGCKRLELAVRGAVGLARSEETAGNGGGLEVGAAVAAGVVALLAGALFVVGRGSEGRGFLC